MRKCNLGRFVCLFFKGNREYGENLSSPPLFVAYPDITDMMIRMHALQWKLVPEIQWRNENDQDYHLFGLQEGDCFTLVS